MFPITQMEGIVITQREYNNVIKEQLFEQCEGIKK